MKWISAVGCCLPTKHEGNKRNWGLTLMVHFSLLNGLFFKDFPAEEKKQTSGKILRKKMNPF